MRSKWKLAWSTPQEGPYIQEDQDECRSRVRDLVPPAEIVSDLPEFPSGTEPGGEGDPT